jgi:integrase/recombinase XerC
MNTLKESVDYLNLYFDYLKYERNYSMYTIKAYLKDISDFKLFFTKEGFCESYLEIKRLKTVELYLGYLRKQKGRDNEKQTNRSIARKLSSLRGFYRFLKLKGFIEINVFENIESVKIDQPLAKRIDNKEIELLFKSIILNTPLNIRNYLILDMLILLGIRASEITAIKLQDINISRGDILIHGKGSKDRLLPLTTPLMRELQDYIAYTRVILINKSRQENFSDILLLNKNGDPLTVRGLQKILISLVKKTGETYKIHPHMIRHSFASEMLKNGADLRVIQELLGHESIKTTQKYTQISNEDLFKNYQQKMGKIKNKE